MNFFPGQPIQDIQISDFSVCVQQVEIFLVVDAVVRKIVQLCDGAAASLFGHLWVSLARGGEYGVRNGLVFEVLDDFAVICTRGDEIVVGTVAFGVWTISYSVVLQICIGIGVEVCLNIDLVELIFVRNGKLSIKS